MSTRLIKPTALPPSPSTADFAPHEVIRGLAAGESYTLAGSYLFAERLLNGLSELIGKPSGSYEERQATRDRFQAAGRRLAIPVKDHRIALRHAPYVGFLRTLYAGVPSYRISALDIDAMVQSWSRYDRGVYMAVLGQAIHPFFGTYAPTRTSHLELFATWLSSYDGPRELAVDVGTGSGVLAMMLAKAGFPRVLARDTNPNAVESVRRDLERIRGIRAVEPEEADLLAGVEGAPNVIVFNPPWLPGKVRNPLEAALHYDDDLFPRFFDQAAAQLAPDGRIAMLFSNIVTLTRPDVPHPIETELASGRFRLESKLQRRVQSTDGRRTKERVEVWVLARA